MTKEELQTILEKHKLWLSNGEGERADLCYASLRYANLCNADLCYASLRSADLRYADLRYANLCNADLRYADLRNVDLCYASLRSADLCNVDLRYANLCNADLRNASLRNAYLHEGFTVRGKVYQLTNVGSENGTLLIADCKEGWYFNRGCFKGSKEEFLAAVRKKHGKSKLGKFYKKIVKLYTEVLEE